MDRGHDVPICFLAVGIAGGLVGGRGCKGQLQCVREAPKVDYWIVRSTYWFTSFNAILVKAVKVGPKGASDVIHLLTYKLMEAVLSKLTLDAPLFGADLDV